MRHSGDHLIAFITGPSQVENHNHTMMIATKVAEACEPTETNFILKTSYYQFSFTLNAAKFVRSLYDKVATRCVAQFFISQTAKTLASQIASIAKGTVATARRCAYNYEKLDHSIC